MTYLLMVLFLLCIIEIFVTKGLLYDNKKQELFSKNDSLFLRGLWCIVVVLVHIPQIYQNKIQDIIGSFGYIGVTFFFLTSAFGLKNNLIKKENYMKSFWKKRLPSLLLPILFSNIISFVILLIKGGEISFFSLIYINDWIKALLFHYLIFWIVYYIMPKHFPSGEWQDDLLCFTVVLFSVFEYFSVLKYKLGWPIERLGFCYGIIIASKKIEIKKFLNDNWLGKVLFSFVLSLLFGVAYLKYKQVYFYGDYLLRIFLGAAITSFVLAMLTRFVTGNKISSFFGSISYEIYLTHPIAFSLIMIFDSNNSLNSSVFIWLSLIITTVLSYFIKTISNNCLAFLNKWIFHTGGAI